LNSGILVELEALEFALYFKIINMYGLYVDDKLLWEDLDLSWIISWNNLILEVDLNFTISIREVWGKHPRCDPHEGFFANLFEVQHLVDLKPPKLTLTWRNDKKGEARVLKWLNRFLIYEALLDGQWILKS